MSEVNSENKFRFDVGDLSGLGGACAVDDFYPGNERKDTEEVTMLRDTRLQDSGEDCVFAGMFQRSTKITFDVSISEGDLFLNEDKGMEPKAWSQVIFVAHKDLSEKIATRFTSVELEPEPCMFNFPHPNMRRGKISSTFDTFDSAWAWVLKTMNNISGFADALAPE